MTFDEALKKLRIEDYGERIFKSNSHGELFHLMDYIVLAKSIKEDKSETFRKWFEDIVKQAEETWNRSESIFQHILNIIEDGLSHNNSVNQSGA